MYEQIEQSVRSLLFPAQVQKPVKEEQKPQKSEAQTTGAEK
jgi:hypothetical protein